MGRKKFEEVEYDPIETEAKRSLAKMVSQPGLQQESSATAPKNVINLTADAAERPVQPKAFREKKTKSANKDVIGSEKRIKSRTFSCANSEQDSELDSFLLRLKEGSGTHVPFQVLMRAACVVAMRAEEHLMAEVRKNPPPPMPAKFAHEAYAEFEEYWIDTLQSAVRKIRPLQ